MRTGASEGGTCEPATAGENVYIDHVYFPITKNMDAKKIRTLFIIALLILAVLAATANSPIALKGAGLGLISGIANFCMLAVFLFLAAQTIGAGDKKAVLRIGSVFTVTVFMIYFLVVLLVQSLFSLYLPFEVKIALALLVLVAGVISIKDFFFFGKWLSLKIPESSKPMISKLAKSTNIISTVFLAVVSTLLGLPCIIGILAGGVYAYLPEIRSGGFLTSVIGALAYSIAIIVPLLVLIGLIYLANMEVEKAEKWRLGTRKYMKLAAGIIMIALGVCMLVGWI